MQIIFSFACRIKLYLEQFGILSCVLNSELPATVRCHSLNQFNQGMYDIIVASDEKVLELPEKGKISGSGKRSKRKKDKGSGVSRGIDFQNVTNIINVDFPLDAFSYVHRAGRTARGNNQVELFMSFVVVNVLMIFNHSLLKIVISFNASSKKFL